MEERRKTSRVTAEDRKELKGRARSEVPTVLKVQARQGEGSGSEEVAKSRRTRAGGAGGKKSRQGLGRQGRGGRAEEALVSARPRRAAGLGWSGSIGAGCEQVGAGRGGHWSLLD